MIFKTMNPKIKNKAKRPVCARRALQCTLFLANDHQEREMPRLAGGTGSHELTTLPP